MSKYPRRFPRANLAFNNYFKEAIDYFVDNAVRLTVSVGNLAEINDLYYNTTKGWKVLFSLTSDKNRVNKLDFANRVVCRNKIEKCMTKINGDFPSSVINSTDRIVFRINAKKKSRKRAQKMAWSPKMTIRDMAHLSHRLAFRNPKTPKSKAMPYLNHIVVEYFIGEKGLLPKDIVFTHSMEVRRHLKSIPFSEGDVGKTVYYRCYYANTRDERSLPCAVISEVLA